MVNTQKEKKIFRQFSTKNDHKQLGKTADKQKLGQKQNPTSKSGTSLKFVGTTERNPQKRTKTKMGRMGYPYIQLLTYEK